jgi:hypothetical protein
MEPAVINLRPARSALAALALWPVLALAGPTGYTAWDVSGDDKLVRMDLATGAGVVVGTITGYGDVDGLAFDAAGQLWGVQDGTWVNASSAANKLLKIDINTGAATPIGGFGDGFDNMGLAFADDGTLYMSATNNAGAGKLYTVNATTGSATLIGGFGGSLNMRSLGYYGGTLYGWGSDDTLRSINVSNGTATRIGSFGFSAAGHDGMDADPATGLLWAVAEVEHRTYTLDKLTGVATVVATNTTCNGVQCSGFSSLAISAVPEPANAWMLLAGLLALVPLRRRLQGR